MTILLCILLLGGSMFGVQAYQDSQAQEKKLTQEVENKNKEINALNATVKKLKTKPVSHIDGVMVTDLESK